MKEEKKPELEKKTDINVEWSINKVEIKNERPDIWKIFFRFWLFAMWLSTLILASIYWTSTDMRFLFFTCIFILICWKYCLWK